MGDVLLTSWNMYRSCQWAEEAEAFACRNGLRLAAEWIQTPVILETDRANVKASLLWQTIQEIKALFTSVCQNFFKYMDTYFK